MDESGVRALLVRELAGEPAPRVDIALAREMGRRRLRLRRVGMSAGPLGAAAVAVLVFTGALPVSLGFTGHGGAGPAASLTSTLYVGNGPGAYAQGGAVTRISGGSHPSRETVSVPGGVIALAATPDARTVYALSDPGRGRGSVTPIDTATGRALPAIMVGHQPSAIAITPNGQTAYVSNTADNTITPISVATNTAHRPITVGQQPTAIAVTPNGHTVYVLNAGTDTVTPISTRNDRPGKAIPAGQCPLYEELTPEATALYIYSCHDYLTIIPLAGDSPRRSLHVQTTGGHGASLAADPGGVCVATVAFLPGSVNAYLSTCGGTLLPFNTVTGRFGAAIAGVTSHCPSIAVTPDGTTAYVASGPDTITPITTATNHARRPIRVGKDPSAFAFSADGKTLYVVNHGSGDVTPVSVASGTAGRALAAGGRPWAVAATP